MSENIVVAQEQEVQTGPILKPPKKKRKWKRWAFLAVVLLLVGFWIYSSIMAALAKPVVLYVPVGRRDIESTISTSGTIVSDESKTYFVPASAKVQKVNFNRGDEVKKGDVIAVFDLADLQSSLRKAQIALENAQLNYEDTMADIDDADEDIYNINKELRKVNARITLLELARSYYGTSTRMGDATIDAWMDDTVNGYDNIVAALDKESATATQLIGQRQALRQWDLSENKITQMDNNIESLQLAVDDINRTINQAKGGIVADFDGILTQLNLVEGGTATTGMTAAVLEANHRVKISFNLNKYDIQRLALGQTAVITFGSRTLEDAVVTHIDGAAINTGTGATVRAEVTVEDPDGILKLGMDADVDILSSFKSGVVSVPIETVKTDKVGDYVYTLLPSQAEKAKPNDYVITKVYVQLGISDDNYMEILSGAGEGDLIATVVPKGVESGREVSALPGSGSGGTTLQIGGGGGGGGVAVRMGG